MENEIQKKKDNKTKTKQSSLTRLSFQVLALLVINREGASLFQRWARRRQKYKSPERARLVGDKIANVGRHKRIKRPDTQGRYSFNYDSDTGHINLLAVRHDAIL